MKLLTHLPPHPLTTTHPNTHTVHVRTHHTLAITIRSLARTPPPMRHTLAITIRSLARMSCTMPHRFVRCPRPSFGLFSHCGCFHCPHPSFGFFPRFGFFRYPQFFRCLRPGFGFSVGQYKFPATLVQTASLLQILGHAHLRRCESRSQPLPLSPPPSSLHSSTDMNKR